MPASLLLSTYTGKELCTRHALDFVDTLDPWKDRHDYHWRVALGDTEWLDASPNDASGRSRCSFYYGFDDTTTMDAFVRTFFKVEREEVQSGKRCTEFEQVQVAHLRMRRGWKEQHLADLFGVTRGGAINSWLHKWIPEFGRVGRLACSVIPSPHFIRSKFPTLRYANSNSTNSN